MIAFDAVDFSERRCEELINKFLLMLSVCLLKIC